MKMKKITIILTLIIAFVTICPTEVQASGFTFPSWSELQNSAKNFLNRGNGGYIQSGQVSNIFVPMARILLGFGIIVLVGATIIMGVKYMFASPEEAAKLKQQLVGLVVAAVVIFAAAGIWSFVYTLLNGIL